MTRVARKKAAPIASPLRYNIKFRCAGMKEKERLRIKERVQKRCNISDSTYSRYLNIRQADTADIPGLVLREFAFCLNTTLEELFNEQDQNWPV